MVETPPSTRLHKALAPHEIFSGSELTDRSESGEWCRDVLEAEIMVQGIEVGIARHRRVKEKSFQLGPENQVVADVRVIKRFYPETVAREQESTLFSIPERDRKHAV